MLEYPFAIDEGLMMPVLLGFSNLGLNIGQGAQMSLLSRLPVSPTNWMARI